MTHQPIQLLLMLDGLVEQLPVMLCTTGTPYSHKPSITAIHDVSNQTKGQNSSLVRQGY